MEIPERIQQFLQTVATTEYSVNTKDLRHARLLLNLIKKGRKTVTLPNLSKWLKKTVSETSQGESYIIFLLKHANALKD